MADQASPSVGRLVEAVVAAARRVLAEAEREETDCAYVFGELQTDVEAAIRRAFRDSQGTMPRVLGEHAEMLALLTRVANQRCTGCVTGEAPCPSCQAGALIGRLTQKRGTR